MQTSFNYRTLAEAGDLRGKRVLLRLDLNVPINGRDVRDDFRIQASLPTLAFLKDVGAKVIIISHLENAETNTLEQVAKYLNGYFALNFIKTFDELTSISKAMKDGDIICFENLRLDLGERANNPDFARKLASVADVYVNDAFSVSHRSHASIVGIPPLLPSYAGLRLDMEIKMLSESFDPPRPALFAIGGAKFETKIPIVERFLDIADHVFVGGALANDIFKEKGYEIGRSTVAKNGLRELSDIISNPKLITPSDVVVAGPQGERIAEPNMLSADEAICDAGPDTAVEMSDLLTEVKYVLWNGPLGNYEKGYTQGTEDFAKAIIESGARCVVGGGDTVAVLAKANLLKKFSFVSTGGGAMLDFLAKGTLPGIDALKT